MGDAGRAISWLLFDGRQFYYFRSKMGSVLDQLLSRRGLQENAVLVILPPIIDMLLFSESTTAIWLPSRSSRAELSSEIAIDYHVQPTASFYR